jgi:hypothetical protein
MILLTGLLIAATIPHQLENGYNDGDRGYLGTGNIAGCNSPTGSNNGTVVVEVNKNVSGASDNMGTLPGATGQGTPNSYGYFRFKTKVNP